MKKYKIDFLIRMKPRKHYMKRTNYYRAYSPEHALAKLEDYQGVANGHGVTNTWTYQIISVEEVKQ